ncbi:MAG TPA: hypothetical protein VFR04_04230 [Solirubrobacterales bacterium]|nr:hypothetical protein [Solirubrobacterales bacterium]
MANSDQMRERLRRALAYPYAAPARSFVQVGARTLELSAEGFDPSGRRPLLAYGSNAAPEALTRKLAPEPATALPLVRAALSDFDVVYSAHVSPYGAVPATLHRSPGTTVTVFVAFPTERQRALLSASEPNYEERCLEGIACDPELGEPLTAIDAFLSRHGCLRLGDSEIALSAVPARARGLPALAEPEVLERVRAALTPQLSLEQFVEEAVLTGGRPITPQ